MIKQINEDELFFLTLENNIILKEHCNNFKERMGIKMISEDGTNFLQGVACCDIVKTSNMADNIQIWVNPKCINTDFYNILKFHINELSHKYKENNKDHNNSIFQNEKTENKFDKFMTPPENILYDFSIVKKDKKILCEIKSLKNNVELGNIKYELIETLKAFVIKFLEINIIDKDDLSINNLIKYSENYIINYINEKIVVRENNKNDKIKLFKLSVRKECKEFLKELNKENYIEDKDTKNIVYLYKEF